MTFELYLLVEFILISKRQTRTINLKIMLTPADDCIVWYFDGQTIIWLGSENIFSNILCTQMKTLYSAYLYLRIIWRSKIHTICTIISQRSCSPFVLLYSETHPQLVLPHYTRFLLFNHWYDGILLTATFWFLKYNAIMLRVRQCHFKFCFHCFTPVSLVLAKQTGNWFSLLDFVSNFWFISLPVFYFRFRDKRHRRQFRFPPVILVLCSHKIIISQNSKR